VLYLHTSSYIINDNTTPTQNGCNDQMYRIEIQIRGYHHHHQWHRTPHVCTLNMNITRLYSYSCKQIPNEWKGNDGDKWGTTLQECGESTNQVRPMNCVGQSLNKNRKPEAVEIKGKCLGIK